MNDPIKITYNKLLMSSLSDENKMHLRKALVEQIHLLSMMTNIQTDVTINDNDERLVPVCCKLFQIFIHNLDIVTETL